MNDFKFQRGPLSGTYIIRGYKHMVDGKDMPVVDITSGGIGYRHISMIVTSPYGQGLRSEFQFFGEKVHVHSY